jgi:hypothetical protein
MHEKQIAFCTFVAFIVAAAVCGVANTRQAEDEIFMPNWAKLRGVSCSFCVCFRRSFAGFVGVSC